MPTFTVSAWDVTVVAVYVVGVRIALGWFLARRVHVGGSEEYFLAGRSLRWPLIGLSFYVSNMSGSSFVGLPGSAYHDGIAVYHYEWMAAPILVLFAFFLLPVFLRARIDTAPEYLEKRFDRRLRYAFSAFLLLANVFIDAAAALFAGATVIQVLFPELPLWVTIAVISLLAGGYIVVGGLGAVVLNDALQAVLIGLGGLVTLILTWQAIPSWQAVVEAAPDRALHLVRPVDDPVLPWPGTITGVLVIGIYFWCTNQFMIQRALGAKSLEEARRGALLAGALKLPNLFILVLPGVMAITLYPELERPDLVFPTLAFDLLPDGLRGFMIAALAASILSSLEAILNSASTLFTMDFVRSLRPGLKDRELVRTGRIATVVFMVIAAAWAPQIQHFPTLWIFLQSILSYVTPPVVAVFLIGLSWRRANAPGALAGLLGGVLVGVAGWTSIEILGLAGLHFLYGAGLVLATSAFLMVGVSLTTAAPDVERVRDFTWQPEPWRAPSGPWIQDVRVLSVLLLAASAALVVWWR